MTNAFVLAASAPESREGEPLALAQTLIRKMVLDSVVSPHSKGNNARALDDLFAFCASRPLSREPFDGVEIDVRMFVHSTINVRLSAARKMVGEARRTGMIGQEEAASLTDIPNIRPGNSAGKLADPGAGQGPTDRTRPLAPEREARLCDPGPSGRLCPQAERTGETRCRDHPAAGGAVGLGGPRGQGPANSNGGHPDLGKQGNRHLDDRRRNQRRPAVAVGLEERKVQSLHFERLGGLVNS